MLAVLLAGGLPVSASTDAGAESDLVGRINAERNSRGLPALQVRGDLRDAARRQAVSMADRGQMSHNPSLGSEVCCWRKIGENVGSGPDPGTVHRMMMDSSSHRSNIQDGDFTEIGVGVERRGGTIWVSQVFRQPEGAPEPPPPGQPQAQPGPELEPQPEPEPGPGPERESEPPPPPRSEPSPTPEPDAPALAATLEPVRPCEDGTSVALARALATQIADRAGEVLATLCPPEPIRSVRLQH